MTRTYHSRRKLAAAEPAPKSRLQRCLGRFQYTLEKLNEDLAFDPLTLSRPCVEGYSVELELENLWRELKYLSWPVQKLPWAPLREPLPWNEYAYQAFLLDQQFAQST